MKMKNKLLIILLIIGVLCISGCTKFNEILNEKKPSINYYTVNLINKLSVEEPIGIKVFYKEFFDEFNFPNTEKKDILSFINILDTDNFLLKPSDLPDSYKYKVYIEFKDCKYALTIFNEKYISIYSWDGKYPVDYVDMTEIPLQLNLYSICKFFTSN